MDVWVWSARLGLGFGAAAFILAFVPAVLMHYRRYGRISRARLLGTAAASVYLAAIASYTLLPLPAERSEAWCDANGVREPRLVPFASLGEIAGEIDRSGLVASMTSVTVLQVVFNVALFVPWGVLARGFLARSALTAVVSGAAASLAVELTQATGLWFAYPCAYRLADIDDLIANTLGAAIGALIAPAVLFWMPRSRALQARRLDPRPITAGRRILSMVITAAAVSFGAGTLSLAVRFTVFALLLDRADLEAVQWLDFCAQTLMVLLLVYLPALRGAGSLGQYAVWIAPRWADADGRLRRGPIPLRLLRASVSGIPLILAALPDVGWAVAPFWLLGALSVAMAPFTDTRRSLSGVLTRSVLVDTRAGAGTGRRSASRRTHSRDSG